MEKNHYLDLLTSVDVMNTLGGGRAEPIIALEQHEKFREIRIKIPGLDPQAIEVEVNNNQVSIYYVMNIKSGDKLMKLPYTVYNRQQPYFIDVSKINAAVDDDTMVVTLPFNTLANGYHKRIKTRED